MTRRRTGWRFPSAATRADSSPYTPPIVASIGIASETDVAQPISRDYNVDFTALAANEDPLSLGGLWTNNQQGTGDNFPLGPTAYPNLNLKVGVDAVTGVRHCFGNGPTISYNDAVGLLPGYPGNQRVVIVVYRRPGYAPAPLNHEIEIFVGTRVNADGGKRGVEFGINTTAGSAFLAGFNGGLTSWDAPPFGTMSSPWNLARLGTDIAPADLQTFTMEFNRTGKTIEVWQNSTQIIDFQWNDLTMVTAEAQAVLNDLGNSAGLGILWQDGATPEAFGVRSFSVSSTLLGAP